jgi:hypothetical protein
MPPRVCDKDDGFATSPFATQRVKKVLCVCEYTALVGSLAVAPSHHGVISPYHDPRLRTLDWQEVSRPVYLGLVRRIGAGSGQRGSCWLSNEFLGGGFLAAEEPGNTEPRMLDTRFRA